MSETFEFGVGEVSDDVESQKPATMQQQSQQQQQQQSQQQTQMTLQTQSHDDTSSVTSDGLNTKFIIDNLAPTWGIMLTVQDNLNLRIGMQLKKKYFNAGFWNYISTPINFTITLFTALSAGQTGSGSKFLDQSQLFYVLLTTFVLSIVNTFFKLREKAEINYNSAKQWETYAATFEKIYFTPISENGDVAKRLESYNNLISKINEEYVEETVEFVNYITELFFYFFRLCRIYRDYRYLDIKRRYWVLDGSSSRFYKENIRYYHDKDDGACFKVYDIDDTIFRKDLNKEIKNETSVNKYYFF
jgi:hypothetical protein